MNWIVVISYYLAINYTVDSNMILNDHVTYQIIDLWLNFRVKTGLILVQN